MTHDELKTAINKMDLAKIKTFSSSRIKDLTDDFKDDLLIDIAEKARTDKEALEVIDWLMQKYLQKYPTHNLPPILREMRKRVEFELPLTPDNTQLNEKNHALNTENSSLNTENAKLNTENAEFQARIAELEAEVAELQQKLKAESEEKTPANAFEKIIFFATVLSAAYDAGFTNQLELSELICTICGGSPKTYQPRISKLSAMALNDNYSAEVIHAAQKIVKRLKKVPKGGDEDNPRILDIIKSIEGEFELRKYK